MPTVAELQVVLTARDDASQQLQRVGAQVARLQVQVEQTQRRGGGGGLLGALTGGFGLGAGIQAIQTAMQGVGGLIGFVTDSIFTLNSNLEQSTATFTALTGSVGAAAQTVAALRREAATSPFSDQATITAGRTLITVADGTTESLIHLVRVSEQLAAIDPAQGLEGAAVALREAISGDFQSIAERFELSRESLQRFRDQGLSNLQAVEAELRRLGVTSELVERLGRTFEGRRATIVSFFDELRQRLGSGIFDRISDLFGHMVNLIAEQGDRLRRLASEIGQAVGAIFERVGAAATGPLRALVNAFAPGLWEVIEQELARVPEHVEQTGRAAEAAAPPVQSLTRQLAGLGVAAAELQLEANRVRRSYDDQLEPLQRQLRLLQQSADLQRVQNALATNRATVEGLRLDQEIGALQRAARGVTDPNAPGLTLRQRAIALALQERQLRREELGLQEQQRPAVQSLEQQIAALQEQQRQAVEPLERALQLRRDEIEQMNILRQQEELRRQDLEATNQAARRLGTGENSPEAQEDARRRGEELAQRWLKAYQDWLEAGGGTVWGAFAKTLDTWWTATGQPLAVRIGTDLGTAIGDAATRSLENAFAPHLETLQRLEAVIAFLVDPVGAMRRWGSQSGAGLIPGFLPRPAANRPEGSGAGPNALTGGGPDVSVNVAPGAVQLNGESRAELDERLRQTILDAMANFVLTQQQTDPGASARVQGSGRAP